MSDKHENLLDDTSGETNTRYRRINISHEEDANEEGIVEYLDLELENSSLRDVEENSPEIIYTTSSKGQSQSSVLKNNVNVLCKSRNNSECLRPNFKVNVSEKSVQPESLARTNVTNSMKGRTRKRKASNNHESNKVHAVVDEINAKLAVSINSASNQTSNDGSTDRSVKVPSSFKLEAERQKTKRDSDSLDLFFQSMAQTVMTLPASIQAAIKMEICKVIAMAEMKYSRND